MIWHWRDPGLLGGKNLAKKFFIWQSQFVSSRPCCTKRDPVWSRTNTNGRENKRGLACRAHIIRLFIQPQLFASTIYTYVHNFGHARPIYYDSVWGLTSTNDVNVHCQVHQKAAIYVILSWISKRSGFAISTLFKSVEAPSWTRARNIFNGFISLFPPNLIS